MKSRFLLLVLTILIFGTFLASCDKTEDPIVNDNNETTDNWVGVYDFTATYDSICTGDGTWFSMEYYESMTGDTYDSDYGYLTITKENDRYHLVCTLVYADSGEEVTFFDTWATDQNGLLNIESTSMTYETGVVFDFTFHGFSYNMPQIYFKSVVGLDYYSQGFAYLLGYTCTKRQ